MRFASFAALGLVALGCSSPSNQTGAEPGADPRVESPARNKVAAGGEAGGAAEVGPPPIDAGPPDAAPLVMIPPPDKDLVRKPTEKSVDKNKWWEFNGSYFRLWGTAFTGSQPKGVSVSSDGSRLFVTNTGFHNHKNVTRFDPKNLKTIVEANFKGNAIESQVSPDDSVLWVSNFYHHELLELDIDDLKVKRKFIVDSMPKHFAPHPDGKTLWVSNWATGTTSVVNLETGETETRIKVGKQPRGTVILNSGAKAYVTNFGGQSVSVIDTAKREVIKTIETKCRAPRHADVSKDDRVFVSCYGGHDVLVIDSKTDEIIRRVKVGNGPKTIMLSRDQRFAYTADYRGASMSIIDLETWDVLIVPLPTFKTSGLAVTGDDRRIYLTGWTARNLMVIDRLLPGDVPSPELGPQGFGKVCRQTPKSDCYKYP